MPRPLPPCAESTGPLAPLVPGDRAAWGRVAPDTPAGRGVVRFRIPPTHDPPREARYFIVLAHRHPDGRWRVDAADELLVPESEILPLDEGWHQPGPDWP